MDLPLRFEALDGQLALLVADPFEAAPEDGGEPSAIALQVLHDVQAPGA
jgi:hypothetical protein